MANTTYPIRAKQIDAALAQVRQHRQAGQMDKAVTLVASVVRAEPDHVPALRLMASLAMQTGTPVIAIGCLARATALSPRSLELFVEYGDALLAGSKPAEAEKAFRHAISLRAKDGAAFRGLAQAQVDQGDKASALKSFRKALSILPYDKYAAHMAASLSGEADKQSSAYVPELFDKYADTFDEHLTGTLEYGVPQAIHKLLEGRSGIETMLDLGCGTGLVAAALADLIAIRDGIDISPRMVAKAEARGIYRHLAAGDISATLDQNTNFSGPYDLVAAGDVFIYVGELAPVFTRVHPVLGPKGLFTFSVEALDGTGFAIRSSGRFSHAPDYVANLAEANGFDILSRSDLAIRQERNQPIPGHLYLMTRR